MSWIRAFSDQIAIEIEKTPRLRERLRALFIQYFESRQTRAAAMKRDPGELDALPAGAKWLERPDNRAREELGPGCTVALDSWANIGAMLCAICDGYGPDEPGTPGGRTPIIDVPPAPAEEDLAEQDLDEQAEGLDEQARLMFTRHVALLVLRDQAGALDKPECAKQRQALEEGLAEIAAECDPARPFPEPNEGITLAVACGRYDVSRGTLQRHITSGDLMSLRKAKSKPHKVSEAAVAARWTRRPDPPK